MPAHAGPRDPWACDSDPDSAGLSPTGFQLQARAELTLGLCRPQAPASGAQVATGGKALVWTINKSHRQAVPLPLTSCVTFGVSLLSERVSLLWPMRARTLCTVLPALTGVTLRKVPSKHKGAKRTHSVMERAGLGLLRRQAMWQRPRFIVMMTIIIKNFSNKLLSTLQRAFS